MARKEVSDNFKVFSKRLSALMKERGLRQQALADYLGTKRQTISLYMGGQSMPDAEQLKNIALFFDVSADWLLGLADVRSANIEIQAICARTGLSEAAVSGLMDMKQLSQQKKENHKLAELALLSHLIERECTLPYLGKALQYISATFEDGDMPVSMYYKDDDGCPFDLCTTANGFLGLLRQVAINDIGKILDSIRTASQRAWSEREKKNPNGSGHSEERS